MAIWNDYTGLHELGTHGPAPELYLGGGPANGAYAKFSTGSGTFLESPAYADGWWSVPEGEDFCIEYMCREGGESQGTALAVNNGFAMDERRLFDGTGQWRIQSGAVFSWLSPLMTVEPAISIRDGMWHAIAVDRAAGKLRLFVDGVRVSILLNGVMAGTEVDFSGPLEGGPGNNFFIGACPVSQPWMGLYETNSYAGDLAWVRFTRASRESTGFMHPETAPLIVDADPLWSVTTLMVGVMLESGDGGGGGGGGGSGAVTTAALDLALCLAQVDNGVFDLAFVDATREGPPVETLVYAVLFTDQEAPAARVKDRYERRGWWMDPQAGTGLWYVRRQALTDAARREAMEMIRTALEAHAPALSDIEVAEMADGASGRISGLVVQVTGLYAGHRFVVSVPL